MADPTRPPGDPSLAQFEHPRGTLVIVLIFGLLFGLGWLAMYFFEFLGRGGTHA